MVLQNPVLLENRCWMKRMRGSRQWGKIEKVPTICAHWEAFWGKALIFLNLFHWSIVDLQCCMSFWCIAKWFSYTHMYSFMHSFPLWFITECTVLYSRALLFIHSLYNSLHPLIPNSQSIHPHSLLLKALIFINEDFIINLILPGTGKFKIQGWGKCPKK